LEDVSMKGARGVLINITGGPDMTLFEVDEAANRIREEVDPEANIIFGSTFDEKLAGRMRISVVATGIDAAAVAQPRPIVSLVSDRDRDAPAAVPHVAAAAVSAAVPAPAAAGPIPLGLDMPAEPTPAVAQAAESAAVRDGAFIAPRAVEPAIVRPAVAAPVVAPDPYAAAAMENGGRPGPAKKPRGPSLFERVTGVGRSRFGAEPRPAPAVAQAQQP